MDWQLVASYFTVKPTDIFYSGTAILLSTTETTYYQRLVNIVTPWIQTVSKHACYVTVVQWFVRLYQEIIHEL